MKSLIALTILSTMIIGCSGKNSGTKVEAPASNPNKDTVTQPSVSGGNSKVTVADDFKLQETYAGQNLMMIYPHRGNWGWVKVNDEDAKVLYDHMKVKPLYRSGSLMSSNTKTGTHVSCFEKAQHSQPNEKEYACSIYINYRLGTVKYVRSKRGVDKDKDVPDLIVDYKGKNVEMDAVKKTAKISFKDDDAKALFLTMDVIMTGIHSGDKYFDRKASLIDCRRDSELDLYSCEINFQYETGMLDFPTE